jgi:preprotein translocase subunit SecG
MFTLLVSLMVLICIALVILILSQAAKGGGLSGLVGGAATDMMGSQSASDLIKRITRILAAVFMLISLLVGMVVINQSKKGGKVSGGYTTGLQKELNKQPKQAPAPAQGAPTQNMPIPVTPTGK